MPMFREILLPVDLSDPKNQRKAVEDAVALAKASGARLHVLAVVPDFGMPMVAGFFPEDFERQALAAADKELHAFVSSHIPAELAVQHIVAHGSIYREIMKYADSTGCDLIVMASHRPELQDYLLGSNAAKVVRHARQSVLVSRG
jgi:nucleotide-binding universal stress UspA family protein